MAITLAHLTNANTLSPTIPSTTAGNTLVVCISSQQATAQGSVSGVTLGGVADNFLTAGVDEHSTVPSEFADTFIWTDFNCAGGQTAIVISGSNLNVGTGNGLVTVYEVAGLGSSPVIDAKSGNNGNSAAYSSGGAGPTTAAAEFWAGVANSWHAITAAGSPWTDSGAGVGFGASGYQITTSTGTATYSGSCVSGIWAASVVAIKPPGAAAPPPDIPQIAPGPSWFDLFKPWVQRPRPPAEPSGPGIVTATGIFSLAPLALSAQGGQSSPDQPAIQPGPAWFDLFKPQWLRPRAPAPPAGPANVTSSGSFALAPLALSGSGAQTSPDLPQAQPGPLWQRLFRPRLARPLPPPPALQPASATGSLALAPLAFTASGGQGSPDLPQAIPGPFWLRLFKPGLQKPPAFLQSQPSAGVTATGSFTLAPLALSGTGAQASPDTPQASPGPAWLRLFRPWVQRPLPPPPAAQSVTSSGSLSLAPLALAASGAQSGPDVPQAAPGPSWLRLFRPQVPKPLPPQPAFQSVAASGSFALAPLALSGQGAQTSPDLPQALPGPMWLRLLRPQVRRPLPPVPALQPVTSSGSFALAPLALSGSQAGPPQDQPQVIPGPAWLRLFKPWIQRPVPPAPPAWLPPPATSSGSLSLAPLAFSAQGGQSSPDLPQADPGPAWLRFFRPQVQRPVPPVPSAQGVTSSGSLALAPLALAGQAGQSAPDQPQASPGPSWLRFFRPRQGRPYPPTPAVPAVTSAGSLSLAPVALSGTGTAAGAVIADLPQIMPGPVWVRMYRPWQPRPVPPPQGGQAPAGPPVLVLFSTGPARLPWTTGEARNTWTAGMARNTWTAGRARNGAS